MKLIYVYRKLGINVFFSQRTRCEGCYIYIFFGGGGGGVCRGIKLTLSSHSL